MIKLLSTDFDGTLYAEFDRQPIPEQLQLLIGELQDRGVKWVINTGRDMPGLMEALERPNVFVKPDYLVLVEREIHCQQSARYIGWHDWNDACHRSHEDLFHRVRADLPRLTSWVESRFKATIYEDAYSPFCLIAGNSTDAETIHAYMEEYCQEVPNLKVVRNDIYARFCHENYNKGTALAEICKRLKIDAEHTLAAGDHLNDIPMLDREYARYLIAPSNAISSVKQIVTSQGGFVADLPQGHGLMQGLRHFMHLIDGKLAKQFAEEE